MLRIDTPSAIAFSVLSFEQTLLDVDFCALMFFLICGIYFAISIRVALGF